MLPFGEMPRKRGMFGALEGGYSSSREIIDRASMLPIGQYEDAVDVPDALNFLRVQPYVEWGQNQFAQGDNTDLMQGMPAATYLARSLTDPLGTAGSTLSSAYDFLLRPSVEGAIRSLVAQEGPPIFDDGGQYVSGANMMPLDPFNAASLAPIGTLGARGTGLTADVGDLGMFAGRTAKTADHAKLAQAERMAAEGAPREKIWNDTGWFQGADGKWRYEIDDRYSSSHLGSFRMAPGLKSQSGLAKDQFMHPEFFDAYPEAKDLSIQYVRGEPFSNHRADGAYYRDRGLWAKVKGSDDTRSTVLHELQHDIQNREGFARGANSRDFTPDQIWLERNRLSSTPRETDWASVGNYTPEMTDAQVAYALYRRHAGEVEARTTQARRDMTPEQRLSRPPWLDYDVPEANQIVNHANPSEASLPSLLEFANADPTYDANNSLPYLMTNGPQNVETAYVDPVYDTRRILDAMERQRKKQNKLLLPDVQMLDMQNQEEIDRLEPQQELPLPRRLPRRF